MARIVYITNGMASTLNSGFEMSQRLVDAGHQVSWLSGRESHELIVARGFDGQVIESDQTFLKRVKEINNQFSRLRPLQFLSWFRARRELRRQSIENDEITQKVKALQPDLLLIDYEMHFAIIATAKLGIPTLLPIVWFSIFHSLDLPPLHTDLPPATTESERQEIHSAWSKLWNRRRWSHAVDRFGPAAMRRSIQPIAFTTNRRADLRKVAQANRFLLDKQTGTNHWIKPHAYLNLPALCFNASELEFPHPYHPNMNYVGPMIDHQRNDDAIDPESIARWHAFLKERKSQDTQRPLMYCSLGTYWSTDKAMIQTVIDAVRNRPDWQLVVGLGGKSTAESFHDIPDNVLLLDYAPQLQVIQHADVAITHGGITSINEYIAGGLPMLVCSTGHVDQDGCAARIRHHGLGLVADPDDWSQRSIESQLKQLLKDDEMKQRVNKMRETFLEYKRQGRAVQVIEHALKKSASK